MNNPENISQSNADKTLSYIKVNNVINANVDEWKRPWNLEKFDDLYNRDERFFAVVMKGLMSWLNRNILMYNKSINHFIFNTGSSYMYVESNGYEYSWCETTGEDQMYMHLPRCIVEISNITIDIGELTQPFSRGNYERRSGDLINGYNAEIGRIPITLEINLRYILSNFNESLILVQEMIDSIIFQKYFNVTYLGQIIECSIEFTEGFQIQLNKIDMESSETNQKIIELPIKVDTNYPIINTRSEIKSDQIIAEFDSALFTHDNMDKQHQDKENLHID